MESFTLRLVRESDKPENDDLIRISFISPGKYQIKTYYPETQRQFIQTLSYMNVFDYVHSLFTLLIHDKDPFKYVQIEAPNTPTVLLAVDNLNCGRIYQAIDSLLHVTLSMWSSSN